MKIIAGNFKAHLTRSQVDTFTKGLDSFLTDIQMPLSQIQVDIFPSHTALLADNFTHFHIGAQNAYFAPSGGFTGEIGLLQIQEFGINRLIIGHSERRTLFGENQDFINKKFRFYAEAGFHIYYCIGEPLEVREKGESALKDYLSAQLSGIDTSYSTLVRTPLLYGGSVKPSNAKEILSLPYVNGVLVGSASLDLQSFEEIIRASF